MSKDLRLAALRRFAVAITVLNIAGHAFLGFEQSLAQVFASLATAYCLELLLETIDAVANQRKPRFLSGPQVLLDFLLPSHITGLAVGMLLYANDTIFPIVFASTVAIASKRILQAPLGNTKRHFFNPSNIGISVTLLLFPWVGIAPPYQFSENLSGIAHWILPSIFILTGTFLNARFTRRIPLILAWVGGFAFQAIIRNLAFGTSWEGGLLPITGVAFLLFTFYMITDPGTTPTKPASQMIFGGAVALTYSVLLFFHVAYGFFFALAIVCALRGVGLYLPAARIWRTKSTTEILSAPETASAVLREAES